jgi:sulfite exporter TauE/SafE
MEGFFLGLSCGTGCLVFCAPVFMMYVLVEGQSIKKSYTYFGEFILGRLVGYLVFALITWLVSLILIGQFKENNLLFGIAYVVLAVVMIVYVFRKKQPLCVAEGVVAKRNPEKLPLFPLILGILTGLNLCPPFILAIIRAIKIGDLTRNLLFFIMFFLGTSIYLLPIPLIGFVKAKKYLLYVGKVIAILVAFYYLYVGIMTITNGG